MWLGILLAGATAAAATAAGTRITNVARLDFAGPQPAQAISSNQVDLLVGEMLDVVLSAGSRQTSLTIASGSSLPFSLTNVGNGQEAFELAGSLNGGSATVRAFAIDLDGDGHFDPAHDRLLDGDRTPPIPSGASLALLAVLDPTASPGDTTALTVTARCITGSGSPGAVFAGQGDDGSDAVVGATGGMARLVLPFAGGPVVPSLIKTQSVRATDGSSLPSPGAIVTYVLEARFAGPAAGVRVADPIPAGTAYVPGSLQLDGAPLSDAADADRGAVVGGVVAVALGEIAAAVTHIVQFQVMIQ